jgi:hypothetical protein
MLVGGLVESMVAFAGSVVVFAGSVVGGALLGRSVVSVGSVRCLLLVLVGVTARRAGVCLVLSALVRAAVRGCR